jgi:hypothetical protein
MRLALMKLQAGCQIDWLEIDIDRDPDLIRLYDTLVPVLTYQGKEVCHYFIDEPAIKSLIDV